MRLKPSDYAKIMLLGLYRKPGFILATILSLYFIVTVTLDYFNVIEYYSDTPWFEISCGLFFLLAPSLIVLISARQFVSNPSFGNDIKFTFDDQGMSVEGLTFKGQFSWGHLIKQKEIGSFLILYHTKNTANFIDKTKLTTDQLNFIKTKVRQK
jgi:hypothetical protein